MHIGRITRQFSRGDFLAENVGIFDVLGDSTSMGINGAFTTPTVHVPVDTPVSLVLSFTGADIAPTFPEELVVTIPAIHFSGETPQVAGVGIIEQPAPFDASNNQVDPPITIEYQSTDTAV